MLKYLYDDSRSYLHYLNKKDMKMKRQIETDRLLLKPLSVDDASAVFEWVSDPAVNAYMVYKIYSDINEVKKWILSLQENDNNFGIYLKSSNRLIGAISIPFSKKENAYSIGYNMNKDYWNKGFTTEASKAIIKWAHQELHAREFVATYANSNIASRKVIEKCGFKYVTPTKYKKADGSKTFESSLCSLHID